MTTLSPHQFDLVKQLQSYGDYPTEESVVNEALELLKQRDELRREIQLGFNELDAGKGISGKVVFQQLRDELKQNA